MRLKVHFLHSKLTKKAKKDVSLYQSGATYEHTPYLSPRSYEIIQTCIHTYTQIHMVSPCKHANMDGILAFHTLLSAT